MSSGSQPVPGALQSVSQPHLPAADSSGEEDTFMDAVRHTTLFVLSCV